MTAMATQSNITPPMISSRNKSLVSLRESLLEGFLEHNINNKKSQTPRLPVTEVHREGKPACVSPTNSSNDLRQQMVIALDQQQQHLQEEREPSPRPIKKRKVGPASSAAFIAIAEAEALSQRQRSQQQDESTAILQRKALAAKLRARGVSLKLVLKPSDFARSVFCKNRNAAKLPIKIPFFPEPSDIDQEIHAKHSHVLYNYIRKGTDLEGFKKCVREVQQIYYEQEQEQQQPFRCSNRFGESLMHLACRRGRTEMVRFLVEELPGACGSPSQMLAIKDDCHKTPLHDACWTPSPNFELVDLILDHAPEQVLMQDIRGNTPFDYVRKEDYGLWLRFLWERRSTLGVRGRTVTSNHQIPTN
jgi:ankyrin repeat protein